MLEQFPTGEGMLFNFSALTQFQMDAYLEIHIYRTRTRIPKLLPTVQ